MDTISFRENIIFDVKDIVSAFMLVYKSGEALDSYDHVFVEEVITAIYPAIMDLNNFESILGQQLMYFVDGAIRYKDYNGSNDQSILMDAATILAQDLVTTLKIGKAYINNYFPYTFRELRQDYAIVFEFAPELVGDRYCVLG